MAVDLLPNVSLHHQPLYCILKNKDLFEIDMENLKIITVVRNPYHRIMSDLFFYKLININSTPNEVYIQLIKFIKDKYTDGHNLPQYLFLLNKSIEHNHNWNEIKFNNEYNVKFILLRTESLKEDMKRIGFPEFNYYENKNSEKNINYDDYLNDNSIKLINQYYDKDFYYFGYTKK